MIQYADHPFINPLVLFYLLLINIYWFLSSYNKIDFTCYEIAFLTYSLSSNLLINISSYMFSIPIIYFFLVENLLSLMYSPERMSRNKPKYNQLIFDYTIVGNSDYLYAKHVPVSLPYTKTLQGTRLYLK